MVTRLGLTTVPGTKLYLKEWREQKGWTQQELADRMETTKATVSRVENGMRDWSKGYLEAMAFSLGCQVPDLFRHPNEMTCSPIKGEKEILDTLQRIDGLSQRGIELAFLAITTALETTQKKSSGPAVDDQLQPANPHREPTP